MGEPRTATKANRPAGEGEPVGGVQRSQSSGNMADTASPVGDATVAPLSIKEKGTAVPDTASLVARLRAGIVTKPAVTDKAYTPDFSATVALMAEAADALVAAIRERDEARALNEQNFGRTLVQANHDLRAEVERLTELVRQFLRAEYDGPGLRDCTDNDGVPYQSADLAKHIAAAEELVAALQKEAGEK